MLQVFLNPNANEYEFDMAVLLPNFGSLSPEGGLLKFRVAEQG
jgi:hypothetical protein